MKFDAGALDLDIIGALEGTDKSSSVKFCWDYLRHYQGFFEQWRDRAINMIEIGVAHGNSLKVWRSFFSKATIVGIDIKPECAKFAGDRVAVEIGSQVDPEFLSAVFSKYPPTIVIDDGSHQAHHIVFTFENTFPSLMPGGVYIIEDTGFHFGKGAKDWAGDGSVTVPDYFVRLARDRMTNGANRWLMKRSKKYIVDNLDEIMFIGCSIIIRKRASLDIAGALAQAEAYLAKLEAPTAMHHIRLGDFILKHNGPAERAVEAANTALSLSGWKLAASTLLVSALERQGNLDEAALAAARSAKQFPHEPSLWAALARVQKRRGDLKGAAEALRAAIALRPTAIVFRRELSDVLEGAADLPGAIIEAEKVVELSGSRAARKIDVRRLSTLRQRITASAG